MKSIFRILILVCVCTPAKGRIITAGLNGTDIVESLSRAKAYDTLWIAQGYHHISKDIYIPAAVCVCGGFSGQETAYTPQGKNAASTILDFSHHGRVQVSGTLEGITIRSGFTTENGGGILLESKGIVQNCRVEGCLAQGYGGGIFCNGGGYAGSVLIVGCQSCLGAGGIDGDRGEINNCTIVENKLAGLPDIKGKLTLHPDPCNGNKLSIIQNTITSNSTVKGLIDGKERDLNQWTTSRADNDKFLTYTAHNDCGDINGPIDIPVPFIGDLSILNNQRQQVPAILCAGDRLILPPPDGTSIPNTPENSPHDFRLNISWIYIDSSTITSETWLLDNEIIHFPYTVSHNDNGKKLSYSITTNHAHQNSSAITLQVRTTPQFTTLLPANTMQTENNILELPSIPSAVWCGSYPVSGQWLWADEDTPVTFPHIISMADNNKHLSYSISNACGTISSGTTLKIYPCMQNFIPDGTEKVGTTLQLMDKRDKKLYRIKKMADNKWWMAQNINCGEKMEIYTPGIQNIPGIQKLCYDNNEAYCDTYGGLYSWEEAVSGEKNDGIKYSGDNPANAIQGICPDNWHMSSDQEWKDLERALGMPPEELDKEGFRSGKVAIAIKANTLWRTITKQNNTSGFSGLPAGSHNQKQYYDIGEWGSWWTSTDQEGNAYKREICDITDYLKRSCYAKGNSLNVRCVKND